MFKKVLIVSGIACLLIFNICIRNTKAYNYNESDYSSVALSYYYVPADRLAWIPNIFNNNIYNRYQYSLSQPVFNQSLNPIYFNLWDFWLNPISFNTAWGQYLTSLYPISRFTNSFSNLRESQNFFSRDFYINNPAFFPNINNKTDNEQCACKCIIINDNIAPIANAGFDQNVPVGSRITLFGGNSIDLDDDNLLYDWSFISIPEESNATLSDPTIISPSFIADTKGDYIIQLIVSDGKSNSDPDIIDIAANNHIIASYHFDELSGNKAIDSSGNGLHGNIYNASWNDGKVGGALLLNGSDSEVSIPSFYDYYENQQVNYYENQQISIDVWIKFSSLDVEKIYLVLGSPWTYKLQINSGKLEFLIYLLGEWKIITSWDEILDPDIWYYIAITFNAYEARTYINGIEVDYNPIINPIKNRNEEMYVGGKSGCCYFDIYMDTIHGIIDEVRIFNIALTPEEIYNYYLETN